MKINIENSVLKTIKRISKKYFPKEACALLIGKKEENSKKIKKAIQAENVLDSPISFEIDPKFLAGIIEKIENNNEELLGFFHSHPRLPAYVSNSDKRGMKLWPNKIWLIAGLNQKGVLTEIKAFSWSKGPVELVFSII